MRELTDDILLERLKKGETEAVDELYRRYSGKLYVFFNSGIHPSNPEDHVHDIFIKIIKKAEKFNPRKASFQTWLFSIARYHMIDVKRRESRFKSVPIADNTDSNTSDKLDRLEVGDEKNTDEKLYEEFLVRSVRKCINKLEKEEEKQAVILYYLSGKVYREISEIFGRSVSMIKRHVNAAKENIKVCLENRGIDSLSL
ncbi:RNA polymerase sigma factor [candidate division KSB1 bacterium]